MLKALKTILEIQELDMQMIQLMRLKKERQQDLDNINSVKKDLSNKAASKEKEIFEIKTNCRLQEGELNEVLAKQKKLEQQQNAIKKVEEFNALNQEMSQTDRERIAREQKLSDIMDKLAAEEDVLKQVKSSLESTIENSRALEEEILERIGRINKEGQVLKTQRDDLVKFADPDVFRIYERLLRNKRDRVVVPIENRCCSGCHIMLTAQDENMVRKGERLVFCEHCSRIHYWQDGAIFEGAAVAVKSRRRRTTKV
jgi:uncharacterized protein